MNGLPLHPMLVHIPLALAALMPLAALAALGFHLARRGSRGLFLVVVVLQAILALGAVAALRSGEGEEERVEAVVPEAALEAHEEAAEVFLTAAWGALLVTLVPALWPHRRGLATLGAVASLLATTVVLLLGIRVGEAGAALVYRHGAATAYTTAPPPSDPGHRWQGKHEEEDDDD